MQRYYDDDDVYLIGVGDDKTTGAKLLIPGGVDDLELSRAFWV